MRPRRGQSLKRNGDDSCNRILAIGVLGVRAINIEIGLRGIGSLIRSGAGLCKFAWHVKGFWRCPGFCLYPSTVFANERFSLPSDPFSPSPSIPPLPFPPFPPFFCPFCPYRSFLPFPRSDPFTPFASLPFPSSRPCPP